MDLGVECWPLKYCWVLGYIYIYGISAYLEILHNECGMQGQYSSFSELNSIESREVVENYF